MERNMLNRIQWIRTIVDNAAYIGLKILDTTSIGERDKMNP